MTDVSASRGNGPLIHGTIYFCLLACACAIPPLRIWPWIWAAPFVVYFLFVAMIPSLRRSFEWLRTGRVSWSLLGVTLGLMALTALVLLAVQRLLQPDVRVQAAALPIDALGGAITAGIVFTTVNATLEEFVFRGVLFDALESQWGIRLALIATSLLFGVGHLRGYPPGMIGACLAAGFGLAVAWLRVRSGGLLLPVIAHIGADVTIYSILIHTR